MSPPAPHQGGEKYLGVIQSENLLVHPTHQVHPRRSKSQFSGHFLLWQEDFDLELVVLDRLLEATTKKGRQLFEEKSSLQTKSWLRLCLLPINTVARLRYVWWSFSFDVGDIAADIIVMFDLSVDVCVFILCSVVLLPSLEWFHVQHTMCRLDMTSTTGRTIINFLFLMNSFWQTRTSTIQDAGCFDSVDCQVLNACFYVYHWCQMSAAGVR